MKNLKYLTLFLVLSAAFIFFYACTKEENKNHANPTALARTNPGNLVSSINFPANTIFTYNDNKVSWILPDGYTAVGIDTIGNFFRAGGGEITCTCTKEKGGCSPASAGGQMGCVMTECSMCEKKESLSGIAADLDEIIIISDDEMNYITQFSALNHKKIFSSKFQNLPEFTSALSNINNLLVESENPDIKKTIFTEIHGIVFTLEVPADIDDVSISLKTSGVDGGKITCTCLTSGSCPKKNKLVATYCDALECQSCKMRNSIVLDTNGNEADLIIDDLGFIVIH